MFGMAIMTPKCVAKVVEAECNQLSQWLYTTVKYVPSWAHKSSHVKPLCNPVLLPRKPVSMRIHKMSVQFCLQVLTANNNLSPWQTIHLVIGISGFQIWIECIISENLPYHKLRSSKPRLAEEIVALLWDWRRQRWLSCLYFSFFHHDKRSWESTGAGTKLPGAHETRWVCLTSEQRHGMAL